MERLPGPVTDEVGPEQPADVASTHVRWLALQAAEVQDRLVLLEETLAAQRVSTAALAGVKEAWRDFLRLALVAAVDERGRSQAEREPRPVVGAAAGTAPPGSAR